MNYDSLTPRKPEASIDPMFIDRWSPRSFLSDKLTAEEIKRLFEAARWAPSCYNEQPWFFFYAISDSDRKLYASCLVEKNRLWAEKAPLLVLLAYNKTFSSNKKTNTLAQFDSGSAWMSLALEGRKLGLYAHAMAGFNKNLAHKILDLPKDQYEVIVAIAVGRKGDAASLPEELQKMEIPNDRKPLNAICFEWKFET